MRVSEQRTFRLPREEVWARLMDFAVLARTLPGVTRLDPLDGDTCALTVEPPVSSITGAYQGTVRVVQKTPIEGYVLRGEAKGTLGWVRGDAHFELADEDAGTRVASTMSFQTGGVLSGVGQRFMEGVAKSLLRQFFNAFEHELAAQHGNRPAGDRQREEER